MSDTGTDYCVTVTPTIMDGTVVRWFASEAAMRSVNPVISASRNRVYGHGEITPELFDAAWSAHLALKTGHEVEHLETHRHKGVFSGEYEPVDSVR